MCATSKYKQKNNNNDNNNNKNNNKQTISCLDNNKFLFLGKYICLFFYQVELRALVVMNFFFIRKIL